MAALQLHYQTTTTMIPITALASNKQKHQIPSLINFDEGPSEHSNIVTLQNLAHVECDQSETGIQDVVHC